MKKVLFLAIFLLLSGCSGDPYKDYLGLWERTDQKRHEVMEISQDGETILMNDNILRETDFFGEKKRARVLKKNEGQLSIGTGLGSAQFGLSEDRNILRVADLEYKRIDSNRLKEIKAEVEKEKQEREQAERERKKRIEEERIAREKARLEAERERKKRIEEKRIAREKCDELVSEINKEVRSIRKYSGNNKKWKEEYNKIKEKYTKKAQSYKDCSPYFWF